MPPDSPPFSQATSPPPSTQRSQTGYVDAARRPGPTPRNNNNRRRLPRNASIVLYSNQQYDHLLTTDPVLLAMARSQNPNSVVFNFQQLCANAEIEDILVQQIGPVVALSSRPNRQHHLLAKVLFKDQDHRKKAIDSGIIVKNERITALPHVDADTNLLKINLYQLPVCDPHELKDELFTALSYYGQVAQIRAYVSQKHNVFKGEATALLDMSLWRDRAPTLPRFLHLESLFPACALVRAKGMAPYCTYCKVDGHFISKCAVIRQQRQLRPQPCVSCNGTDHINSTDIRCTQYHSPESSPHATPEPSCPGSPPSSTY
ncbi:hypothetical protein BJV82DRAFT_584226 [Fennellomyces sp. T-0311]|nr:hypothetical protein BJV82DRAFT_584226 [Fennellomyces sp. T-0311]